MTESIDDIYERILNIERHRWSNGEIENISKILDILKLLCLKLKEHDISITRIPEKE